MPNLRLAIGSDHAGYESKKEVIAHLKNKGIEVLDFGTNSSESVDYPDFIHPVADAILAKKADLGIILCGSGNGVAMTANKYQHIRAAIAWNTEIAQLARLHNDANILAIPARFVDKQLLIEMVDTFFETEFEGGRHARRVKKIAIPKDTQ